MANRETQKKLNETDQFYIGSISKQITAVLILREYEKNNLHLSDPIGDFLPELTQSWSDAVTIHHLLTHTHGIVSLDKPLEFEPGSQFQYSQIGYGLLSQVLEKICGLKFEEISTRFFAETGLKNTFHPSHKVYKKLATGYEESDSGQIEIAFGNPVEHIAAGGFISNSDDLLRWNELLYSGKLLKTETLRLMQTRYATRQHPVFGKIEYGYGLLFKLNEQDTQIGAFGYVPGFPTANYYFPKTKVNLVVLSNVARSLDDFKETFRVHTELMDLARNLKE